MRPFEITKETLQNLIKLAETKSIELPSFQREYTWEIEKQKGLIASIFCGIPASSFLVYQGETKFEVRDLGLKGSLLRQSTQTSSQLLDGQQRLTTIYSVFSNIFNKNNPPSTYFNKITNRWYIEVNPKNHSLDLFNLQILDFKYQKISKESSTENIKDLLIAQPVDNPNLNSYYTKTESELNEFCIQNNLIPLFYLEKNIALIRIILNAIANNYKTKLQTWLESNTNTEVTSNLIKQHPDSKFDDYINNRTECEIQLATLASKWVDDVRDYFVNFLEYYEQSIVKLNEIDKIVEAFYIINTSGVKLTTFDLLCAKLNKLQLRTLIKNNLIDSHNALMRDNTRKKIQTDSILNIVDSKKGINEKYYQYFTQVFGLYHKLIKQNNHIESLTPDDIKSQKVLNINFDLVDESDIDKINNTINKTLIFLATHCGLRSLDKITNELALIPIFSLVTKHPTVLDKKNEIELIKKFYFQRLLLGVYNSNQNAKCIEDALFLKNIYDESKKPNGPKPKTKIFNEQVGNEIFRNDFIKFENINHWDKNNLANKSAKDFCATPYFIKYNDVIEIHHVIPIGSVTSKFNEAYKNYRNLKHHRINSVLNLAIIKKDTNKKISDATVEKYMDRINNPGIFGSHFLDDTFKEHIKSIPEDVTEPTLTKDEQTLYEMYKIRYQRIRDHACQVLIIN
jgi:hypothetical protein